ncbi:unnamed protein product [Paramecium pentaurelia]|uniref:WD40-repeat-containing domain n=1 Tax=Paramecium pentaurelia TaxID=43138 RepID=A0A8S1XR61_9CILI|nr:unnamed protein product [Paramecium pentaurelia]
MSKQKQSNSQIYNFEPIGCQIKRKQQCQAFAFNTTNTLLFVGFQNSLEIYSFSDGTLKYLRQFKKHKEKISSLNYLKRSQNIISSSFDNSIIVWSKNLLSSSKYIQKLSQHNEEILCLVIEPIQENWIVSGSHDETIKFWIQKKSQWIVQKSIEGNYSPIWSLSMLESGVKLISLSSNYIMVFKYCNSKWILDQKIEHQTFGLRVCFINNETFIFQPEYQNFFYIYTLNKKGEYITKTKNPSDEEAEPDDNLFPALYNNNKSIVLLKNMNDVSIFKVQRNQNKKVMDFKINQIIKFQVTSVYGTLSDDGEYLITWDDHSKLIQVRKWIKKK